MSDLVLPPELQKKAVDHLRDTLHPDSIQYLRELHERDPEWGDELTAERREEMKEKYGFVVPVPFHFSTGMTIRNILRGAIKDSELPGVQYPEGEMHNWDDWYHGVLNELVNDSESL